MNVAAIVLAAGRSSRFGSGNKLLQGIDGRPMVRRVAELALASRAHPIIVVTGFEADRVGSALAGLDVALLHNPDFSEGLSTSLRAGLGAVPLDCAGALVMLGDMPRVEAGVIDALLAAFDASGAGTICVPVHDGRRGNPVLWGRGYFAEMMTLTGDRGAKALMQRHSDHVVEVGVTTGAIFEDFDVAADFRR